MEIMTYRERTVVVETEAEAGAVVVTKKTTAATETVTTTIATVATTIIMTTWITMITISMTIIRVAVPGVVDVYQLDGECPVVHG